MATAKQEFRIRPHKNKKRNKKLARSKKSGGIKIKDDGTIITIEKYNQNGKLVSTETKISNVVKRLQHNLLRKTNYSVK